MVHYGRGDCMLKKKINGSWQNISMLKKRVNGAWSDCSTVQKKYDGTWSIVWQRIFLDWKIKRNSFSSYSARSNSNGTISITINSTTNGRFEITSLQNITIESGETLYADYSISTSSGGFSMSLGTDDWSCASSSTGYYNGTISMTPNFGAGTAPLNLAFGIRNGDNPSTTFTINKIYSSSNLKVYSWGTKIIT